MSLWDDLLKNVGSFAHTASSDVGNFVSHQAAPLIFNAADFIGKGASNAAQDLYSGSSPLYRDLMNPLFQPLQDTGARISDIINSDFGDFAGRPNQFSDEQKQQDILNDKQSDLPLLARSALEAPGNFFGKGILQNAFQGGTDLGTGVIDAIGTDDKLGGLLQAGQGGMEAGNAAFHAFNPLLATKFDLLSGTPQAARELASGQSPETAAANIVGNVGGAENQDFGRGIFGENHPLLSLAADVIANRGLEDPEAFVKDMSLLATNPLAGASNELSKLPLVGKNFTSRENLPLLQQQQAIDEITQNAHNQGAAQGLNDALSPDNPQLIGVHNMSPDKFGMAVDQGGLHIPSVAVINNAHDFNEYGGMEGEPPVQAVLPPEVFDPANPDVHAVAGDSYSMTASPPQYGRTGNFIDQNLIGDLLEHRIPAHVLSDENTMPSDLKMLLDDANVSQGQRDAYMQRAFGQPYVDLRNDNPTGTLADAIAADPKIASAYKNSYTSDDFERKLGDAGIYPGSNVKIMDTWNKLTQGRNFNQALDQMAKEGFDRYPYTPEGRLAQARAKADMNGGSVRGTELASGLASPTAYGAPEIKSLSQMRDYIPNLKTASKEGGKSESAIQSAHDYLDELGNKANRNLPNYHPFNSSTIKSRFLGELLRNGDQATPESVSAAMDHLNIPNKQQLLKSIDYKKLNSLLEPFRNPDTQYFESKVLNNIPWQKVTGLLLPKYEQLQSEFGMQPEDVQQLKNNVDAALQQNPDLKVVNYDATDPNGQSIARAAHFAPQMFAGVMGIEPEKDKNGNFTGRYKFNAARAALAMLGMGAAGFIRQTGEPTNLMVTHNLSEEGLAKADELGGLARPSLGIVDPEKHAIEGYGDVTLIGNNKLVTPRSNGARVYAADAYSPRQPRAVLQVDNPVSQLKSRYGQWYTALGRSPYSFLNEHNMADGMFNDPAVAAQYLSEKGLLPKDLNTENNGRDLHGIISDNRLQDDFQQWIGKELSSMGAKPMLYAGTTNSGNQRWIPETMDNIQKLMNKEARTGVDVIPGLASTRAAVTPEFKSISDIVKNQDLLTSTENFEKIKDQMSENYDALVEEIGKYASDKDPNQFIQYDRQATAIGDYLRGEKDAFYGFANVPESLVTKINQFKQDLQKMPTEYFEAKVSRPVQLSEFEHALVKNDVSQKTLDILQKHGIPVTKYGDEDRAAALKLLRDQDNQSRGFSAQDIADKVSGVAKKGQMFSGALLGIQPQKDKNGNVTGYKFDPKMAALGALGMGIAGHLTSPGEEAGAMGEEGRMADIAQRAENQRPEPPTGMKVRELGQSLKEAPITPEGMKPTLDQFYNPESNKGQLEQAQARIAANPEDALRYAHSDVASGEHSATQIELIRQLGQSGDIEKASDLATTALQQATKHGQAVQALSIVQKLSPEGVLLTAQKMIRDTAPEGKLAQADTIAGRVDTAIQKAEQDTAQAGGTPEQLASAKEAAVSKVLQEHSVSDVQGLTQKILQSSDKGSGIHQAISESLGVPTLKPQDAKDLFDMAKQLQDMPEGRAKQLASGQLLTKIADLAPKGIGAKLSSLQSMAMLLNPKTLLSKIALGHTLFGLTDNLVTKGLGSGIDRGLSLLTGERTTAFPDLPMLAKDYASGVAEKYQEGFKGLNMRQSSPYEDLQTFGHTFDSKPMQKLEDMASAVIGAAPAGVNKATFNDSLRGQMKLAGVTEPTENMIQRATVDAKYATLTNDTAISKALTSVKHGLNHIGYDGFGAGDVIMKFAHVPANLISSALDYSPVGSIKMIYHLFKSYGEDGKWDQAQFVRDLSRASVGTATIFGVEATLAKLGLVTGKMNNPGTVNRFEQTQGRNDYQLNLDGLYRWITSGFNPQAAQERPGDKLVQYNWLEPLGQTIASGAELANNKLTNLPSALLNASLNSVNAATESSMFQGMQTLFNTNDPNTGQPSMMAGFQKAVEGIPASLVPASLNDLRNKIDPYTRNTNTNANDPWYQGMVNQVENKLPLLSKNLPVSVDVTGQPKVKYPEGNSWFNTFVNPSVTTRLQSDPTGQELLRLFNNSSQVNQFPSKIAASYKSNGQTIPVDTKTQAQMQHYVGAMAQQELPKVIATKEYQQAQDYQKANMIAGTLSSIMSVAKQKYLGIQPSTRTSSSTGRPHLPTRPNPRAKTSKRDLIQSAPQPTDLPLLSP